MKLIVEKMVNGGYGLARSYDGKVILVEGAYPGEEVIARITRQKRDHAFAKVETILKKSPKRLERKKCEFFGKCGGCQWLDLEYDHQLELKREIVKDQLRWLDVNVEKTVGSDLRLGYRTKTEFTAVLTGFGPRLGLRARHSHEIIPVTSCALAPDRVNEILAYLPKLLEAFDIPIYDFKRTRGILKHVVFRYSFSTDQTMVIFVTKTESFPRARELTRAMMRKFPWIHSIVHVMNSKDSIVLRGPYRTLAGEGVITENLGWETYQIPPTAFFQSNSNVAEKLSESVLESLELDGKEHVLDLYCGVGLFSIKISKMARRVTGVESSRISVKAAKANANINHRTNVDFSEMPVEKFLESFKGKARKVIVDPPRRGLERKVVERLIELSPEIIVYVSCEPSTLSRDLRNFVDAGYTVSRVIPFDMFPQTFHVETMTVLKKEG